MNRFDLLVGIVATLCCSQQATSGDVPVCEPSTVLRNHIQHDIEGYTPNVHCADLNADNFDDVLFVKHMDSDSQSELLVFIGHGDGSFGPVTSYETPNIGSFYAEQVFIRTADLDADGDIDAIVGDPDALYVMWNDGSGVFDQMSISQPGPGPIAGIDAADMDGDGVPEIALASAGSGVVVILGLNQDNEYDEQTRVIAGGGVVAVRIADLDQDGDQDLMVCRAGGNDSPVFLNNGDGSLQHNSNFSGVPLNSSLVLDDIDNDGDPDLLAAHLVREIHNYHHVIAVYKNNGAGAFHSAGWYGKIYDILDEIAVGDINGDGAKDILAVSYHGWEFVLFYNNGSGSFDTEIDYRSLVRPLDVATGDIDGDGRQDVVLARNFYETFTVILNNCYAEDLYHCPDLNDDGAIDFFDVSAFLIAYTSQNPAADFTGNGIFSSHDVFAFLDSFNSGCP